mgnify:CR=1 FL=1
MIVGQLHMFYFQHFVEEIKALFCKIKDLMFVRNFKYLRRHHWSLLGGILATAVIVLIEIKNLTY